ncbi:MAG TPA: DUF3881 domain-containing protein, partial [Lachnospiraceae bacterium]|nr:DUF3881 domain-containing protein [Lachnospiraceae bacterium]
MHSYLRAIGFSNILHRMDLNKLFENILENSDKKSLIQMNDKVSIVEISKEYAEGLGITLRGEQ